MTIFDYVVFFVPNKEQIDKGEKPEIIKKDSMLAKDEKIVNMTIARELDQKWMDRIDEIQIAVRPF